jgi:hypothetical protein
MDRNAWLKQFPITSVCRQDLRGILSEDEIARLDDRDMQEIAEQMADAYCESAFWIDLQSVAEYVLENKMKQEAGS